MMDCSGVLLCCLVLMSSRPTELYKIPAHLLQEGQWGLRNGRGVMGNGQWAVNGDRKCEMVKRLRTISGM